MCISVDMADMVDFLFSLSKLAESSLTLVICILKLHCSNVSQDTHYSDRGFLWFSSVLQMNVEIATYIGPHLFLSMPVSIHSTL
jgi:hypothetical protein